MPRKSIILIIVFLSMYYSCSKYPVSPKNENNPPLASFTAKPDSGNTNTIIEFNASSSTDTEEPASGLAVRWSFNNDGKWDTKYSTTKKTYYQFATKGIKKVILEVKDSGGLVDSAISFVYISPSNTPPVAAFNIQPTSGDVSVNFLFDASESYDNEDAPSILQVRWDWQNDGTWDTEFSTTKMINHHFASEGLKWIALEVKDSGGLNDTIINKFNVDPLNLPPVALFTITPDSGATTDIFSFDASTSYDNEDSSSLLQVRWDWEDDGLWDTDYSTKKQIYHQFESGGTYTVKLEVIDSKDATADTTHQVSVTSNTMTDIDGNVYKTINIGDQWWMAENLKVTHYRNGDEILYLPENADWENNTSGAYCIYGNNESNVDAYGLLYNGYSVTDSRKVAPDGWRIPTDEDWKELETYLGMAQDELNALGYRGTDEGGKLKETGTVYWKAYDEGATNSTGFSARGGGSRNKPGLYSYLREQGYWWSSTPSAHLYDGTLFGRMINSWSPIISRGTIIIEAGISIRCIKD